MSSLLDQAKRGDMEAFTRLFEPLRPRVFAVACRLVGPNDAEDVVMDTFLRAWKALPAFRGGSSLKTWLLRIARNRSLDVIRARHGGAMQSIGDEDAPADVRNLTDAAQPLPGEELEVREMVGVLDSALGRLDPVHRATVLLRYADGLSYAEIAAATGVHIGTVMSRLFNGKRKLRALVEALERGESP